MSYRILITEDEPLVAKLMEKTLKALGYDPVGIAGSGSDAIEMAHQLLPDLVVMDINLPGKVDGIEATRIIKGKLSIPVIYVTGAADSDTLERALTTDPNGYLLKPFSHQSLYAIIEMALYRNKLERDLNENRQLLSQTFLNIADGVVSIDCMGKVLLINRSAEKILNSSESDTIGMSLTDLVHFKDSETDSTATTFEEFLSLFFPEDPDAEFEIVLSDSQSIPVQANVSRLINEFGTITGYILTFRDITLQKNADKALRQINEELERRVEERTLQLQQNNMQLEDEIRKRMVFEHNLKLALEKEKELNELKSRVVATISHEFKTPLTSISTSAQLLEKYVDIPNSREKMFRHFKSIKNSALSLADMVTDVLLLEKFDANKYMYDSEEFCVIDFVKSLIEEFQMTIGKNHNFSIIHSEFPNFIQYDKRLFTRILNNLISNAIKYSPPGSNIRVELTKIADGFYFCIEDQGIGIPPEDQKHLFELFHRGVNTSSYEGSGLGLSITKKSIDFLGGSITFKSKLNEGTRFEVFFPDTPANHDN